MSRAGNSDRFALAALTWVSEPGDARLGAVVRLHGAVKALELIRAGRLPGLHEPRCMPKARRIFSRWQASAALVPGRTEIAAAFHSGLRLICPGDGEWSARLDDLGSAAPLALWARGSGDLADACSRSVAVTGTRACTALGSQVTEALASSLSGRGWTVVSGDACGTDAAAHPRGRDWLAAVAGRGVLVSEDPPGRRATRARFLVRNRVIPALACGTVVAGASARTSALEAARYARELRRPVMAVPGPALRDWYQGGNALIRSGHAALVTSAAEVIDTITATEATATSQNDRRAR